MSRQRISQVHEPESRVASSALAAPAPRTVETADLDARIRRTLIRGIGLFVKLSPEIQRATCTTVAPTVAGNEPVSILPARSDRKRFPAFVPDNHTNPRAFKSSSTSEGRSGASLRQSGGTGPVRYLPHANSAILACRLRLRSGLGLSSLRGTERFASMQRREHAEGGRVRAIVAPGLPTWIGKLVVEFAFALGTSAALPAHPRQLAEGKDLGRGLIRIDMKGPHASNEQVAPILRDDRVGCDRRRAARGCAAFRLSGWRRFRSQAPSPPCGGHGIPRLSQRGRHSTLPWLGRLVS
jgi:hypothetical protein